MKTMIKVFICTGVAFALPLGLRAQYSDRREINMDSLEQVLKTNPPTGAELLSVYKTLSRAYVENDQEKTVYYSRKGISLGESLGDWLMVG
jgi:hypothetical protein